MNKSKLKTYSPQARKDFIAAVTARANLLGLSAKGGKLEIAIGERKSISSLAAMTGRKVSNLSRTLKTMSNCGIVEMVRERNHVRPIAKATDFHIVTA